MSNTNDIFLREISSNTNTLLGEVTINRPLTNSEIDNNFKHLNSTKADLDGTLPFTLLRFNPLSLNNIANSIWLSGTTLTINGAVKIDGDLEVTGIDTSTASISTIAIDAYLGFDPNNLISSIDNIDDANGGGIKIGRVETTPVNTPKTFLNIGYVNFLYDSTKDAFSATTYDNSPINLLADDFITRDNKSFNNLHTQVQNINLQLGTNSVTSTNTFTSNKVISNNNSLKQAIEALDAKDIPSIQTFIGQGSNGNTTEYIIGDSQSGIGITNGDSLLSAINKINQALLYVIHKVQIINSTATANQILQSGRLYIVRLYANWTTSTLTFTLPNANRGVIAFRLSSDAALVGKKIIIQGGNNNTIEGASASLSSFEINLENEIAQFIWDGTTWRII
jgi:hypothetical protein